MNQHRCILLPWARRLILALAVWGLSAPWMVMALGTWVPLVNQAPGDICDTVLLPDGSVMGADLGDTAKNWYRLTPDAHASYINGTWSKIASMHDARDFYATQV